MAIDPTQITTVNAEELPIAPVSLDSIIVHSIGGILYQGTVSEITALIPSVNYQPYEVKQLNVSNLYITANFEENGLGKTDGLWFGWARIDGNNGTGFNSDGATFIGFGDVYNTMRQEVGENNKTIVKNNIPILDAKFPMSNDDNSGGSFDYLLGSPNEPAGTHTYVGSVNQGSTNTPISIMQKSYVQLFIMKLP
jgi:hypothetical protein